MDIIIKHLILSFIWIGSYRNEIGSYKSEIAWFEFTCAKVRNYYRVAGLVHGNLNYSRLLDRVFLVAGELQPHSLSLGPCGCDLDLNYVDHWPQTSKILTFIIFFYRARLLDIIWLALTLNSTLDWWIGTLYSLC